MKVIVHNEMSLVMPACGLIGLAPHAFGMSCLESLVVYRIYKLNFLNFSAEGTKTKLSKHIG